MASGRLTEASRQLRHTLAVHIAQAETYLRAASAGALLAGMGRPIQSRAPGVAVLVRLVER